MATELYQLRVQGRHQQEYNECVLFFVGENLAAGDVFVNANSLLAGFGITILPDWLALFPATYQVERLSAKRQSAAGGVELTTQYQIGTQPGTVSGAASAQQLCPIVRWIPPMGTKTAGRTFLPCIAESDIDANAPIAGWFTRLATVANAMLSTFSAGGIDWTIGVYSRKHDSFVKALTYDTSPIIGWQRRRQRPY
jgi:hypothetical protein